MNTNEHIHSFTDTDVPSTCRERGYTLHKCECGYEHKDNFKPLAEHDFEILSQTEPTCTEGGVKKLRCKSCGAEKAEESPANGHAWGEWNIQQYATCTEDGNQMRFCVRCGLREDQVIPAKGHKLVDPKKSETEKGVVEYFCENCGSTIQQQSASSKARGFFAAHKKGFKAIISLLVVFSIATTLLLTVFAEPFHYHLAKLQIKLGDYTNAYYNLKACEDYKDTYLLLMDFDLVYEEETSAYYNDGKVSERSKQKYDKYGNLVTYSNFDANGNEIGSHDRELEYDRKGNLIGWSEYDIDGSLEDRVDCEYDKKGNLIEFSRVGYDSGVKSRSLNAKYEYDKKGNVIRKYGSEIDSQGETRYFDYKYEYDKKGNITVEKSYDQDGELISQREYEYDKNGNLTCALSKDADGECYNKDEYEYDKRGNVTLEVFYGSDGEVIRKTESEYDNKDNLIFSETYSGDGALERRYVREQTKSGSKATFKGYDEDGNVTTTYEREFDKNDNVTLYVKYDENGEIEEKTEYEYDRKGNRIKESGYSISDTSGERRKSTHKTVYEYDKNGNCIEEKYSYSYEYIEGHTSEYSSTYKYTYDKKGNLISRAYYSDGELMRKYEYKEPRVLYYPENRSSANAILRFVGDIYY